jgi:flagellar biosynthesis protein FlhA
MYVRQLTDRNFTDIPILSYNELESNVDVQNVGVVNL